MVFRLHLIMKDGNMFDIHREEIDWAGHKLVLETGKIARQADGAVLATYGETTVLATVVSAKAPKAGIDFFPLTVNYQEKAFAAGRIPGGYFKREGRPSEKETLVSRLIDRPIRPLFPDGVTFRISIFTCAHVPKASRIHSTGAFSPASNTASKRHCGVRPAPAR